MIVLCGINIEAGSQNEPDWTREEIGIRGLPSVNSAQEIGKERAVERAAFGMILHREAKRPVAQPELLDHIVSRAPRFHHATVGQQIDGLMVRAVYLLKTMRGRGVIPQRLHVMRFLCWRRTGTNTVKPRPI